MFVLYVVMFILYVCLYHVGSKLAGQVFCVPMSFNEIDNLILLLMWHTFINLVNRNGIKQGI